MSRPINLFFTSGDAQPFKFDPADRRFRVVDRRPCDCCSYCADDANVLDGTVEPCEAYKARVRAERLAHRAPELLRVTRRLQFLLTSALLVIEDPVAREIARTALADAATVTEGL